MSTMRVRGAILRITPFIVPTKWSAVPKSVVRVITGKIVMKPVQRYYFDHNATTPVSSEVFAAMAPMMTDVYGNASSIHYFGQMARQALDEARRYVAAMLGATPEEIVFTSGGTEADNLALFGIAQDGHAITTTIEHPAVLGASSRLASVTCVAVDGSGVVDPDAIRLAL